MARSNTFVRYPVSLTLSSNEDRSGQITKERLVNLYPQPTANQKAPYILQSWPIAKRITDRLKPGELEPFFPDPDSIILVEGVDDRLVLGGDLLDQEMLIFSSSTVFRLRKNTSGTFEFFSDSLSAAIESEIPTLIATAYGLFVLLHGGEIIGTSAPPTSGLPSDINPTVGTLLNSRAIVNSTKNLETDKFYVSDVSVQGDPFIFNFDVGNSARLEGGSGRLVAIESFGQIVYFFSLNFIEPWQPINSGNPPLARVSGAIIQGVGAAGSYAITKTSQGIYFLSNQFQLLRLRGYSYEVLSRPSHSDVFRDLAIENCALQTLSISGEMFVILKFPDDKKMFAYSEQTGALIDLMESYDTWSQSVGFANVFGEMFMVSDGKVYELSLDDLSQADDMQEGRAFHEVILPPISGELIGKPRQTIQMRRMVFGMRVGVAENNDNEINSNPTISIEYSKDGQTWSKEYWYPTGRQGEFDTEITWDKKMKFKDLHIRLRFHDIGKISIYSAAIDAREAGR